MNEPEAFKLLTLASARDGRTVTPAVAKVWADDLSWVSFVDAVAAARLHYRESDKWLMPAHVIRNVRRGREVLLPPRVEVSPSECVHVFKGGWCVHCPTVDPSLVVVS